MCGPKDASVQGCDALSHTVREQLENPELSRKYFAASTVTTDIAEQHVYSLVARDSNSSLI